LVQTDKLRVSKRGDYLITSSYAMTFMRVSLAIIISSTIVLVGCVGSASRDSEPNFIQRANVLSKNEYGITIEHSEWGKPIAFRLADEHCASMKKAAVYRGGIMQIGPDMTSSWHCD
jgi:hypothetical protein